MTRPPSFSFLPGQTIRLFLEARERDYSLACGREAPTLLLCIRRVQAGLLTGYLASAPRGTALTFRGPRGYFAFRPSERPAVFVATGTGVAPFASMARSGVSGFTLLHGVRTPEDLYYQDLFREQASLYIPCLSGPIPAHGGAPGIFHGRVTDYLESELRAGSYDFYLCGNEKMIRDATHLADDRFPGSRVYTEIFF
ncbi:MAG: FAD-binding oxidoreductase [bacterium]